ncbi:MMPL domain protein [Syntrophobacter sp. SbD1]|nr:MMPL domain protein [Syntrophobacter sp. SbD1]
MLATWGRWVYRFRWWVLIISVLSLGPAAWLTSQGGRLESAIIPTHTESARALNLMERELPPSLPSFGMIFRSASLRSTDPTFKAEVERTLAPLHDDPYVASVLTAYDGAEVDSRSISRDGRSTIVKVEIKDYTASQTTLAMDIYPTLLAKVHSDTLEVTAFGSLPLNHDLTILAEEDAKRAEMRVLPLVGLVLLLVFGSVLGAALPLAVGLLAVTAGIAGTLLLARITPVLVFAKNVVVMVGLGVSIDYSLFILSRFREEIHRRPVPDALAHTMATTGRAILFSGGTVAIGLFGMLFLGLGHLSSMGIAGAIVVTVSVLYAMTFLPALLAILGPRVDSLRLPLINPRNTGRGAGFWRSLTNMVMAYPWRVLLPAALFLVLLGIPFLHIRLGSGVTELPKTAESRRGMELLRSEFHNPDSNPIIVVVRYPNSFPPSPLTADNVDRIYDLSRWLAKLPAVNHVESIVDLDPSISRNAYVQILTPPMPPLPKGVQLALNKMVGEDIVMLVAQTSLPEGGSEARSLVRTIRESHPPVDGELMVTGESAFQSDLTEAIKKHSPLVVGLIVLVTYFVLFILLGSVLLPLKAVLMNLLSISASFGALVWIFQYGHLASWLRFTPGPILPMTPIMMFCILFGLSMDYEVLLLNRVREEYEQICDNTQAVARSLESTGRMITGAAAIMASVLFAFGLSDLTAVKAMGIGMGIAVVMDATIVRCLLVPATMRLLGRWNWWSPGPIARLHQLCPFGRADDIVPRDRADGIRKSSRGTA